MTDHDETAKRLLPCHSNCVGVATQNRNAHHRECPWSFRPAVAAALAERDAEIERLGRLADAAKLAEYDDRFVKGLERARECLAPWILSDSYADQIDAAIQAEIEKAGKP